MPTAPPQGPKLDRVAPIRRLRTSEANVALPGSKRTKYRKLPTPLMTNEPPVSGQLAPHFVDNVQSSAPMLSAQHLPRFRLTDSANHYENRAGTSKSSD